MLTSSLHFFFKKIRGKNTFGIRDVLKAELTTVTLVFFKQDFKWIT